MLHIVLTFDSLSAKGAEDAALALVAAVPEKTKNCDKGVIIINNNNVLKLKI